MEDGKFVIDLMAIVQTLIVGVGIPLGTQLLKQFSPGAPGWLKTVAPIILVPLIAYAGTLLSGWLGVPVDLTEIINILNGVGVGVGATVAFKLGKNDPQLIGKKSGKLPA